MQQQSKQSSGWRGKERRKYPRAKVSILLKIELNNKTIQAKTIDISANGISFTTRTAIEPFLVMRLTAKLPTGQKINAIATVVRAERSFTKANGAEYRVAMFFTEIKNTHKEMIRDFVRSIL